MSEKDYIVNARLKDGINIKIHKDIFNEVYLPYMYSYDRIQVFYGGGSSGKSTFIFNTVPLNVLLFKRNYLVLQKELKQAKSSCVNEIKRSIEKFKLERYFEWRELPKKVCKCLLNGAEIVFDGLEDVENLKSTVPNNSNAWTDIIVEEATNITENDFDQLLIRQRGMSYDDAGEELHKRIYVIFNPISKSHWIYRKFFLGKWNEEKDSALKYNQLVLVGEKVERVTTSILKTTYKNNKFLSDGDIATLLGSITDENRRNIYIHGKFGSLGKTIFEHTKNYIIVDGLRSTINNKSGYIRMGLDFGGGVAPFAFVKCKIDLHKKKIYIYDEFAIVDITIPCLYMTIRNRIKYCGSVICEQGNDMRKQLKDCGCKIKPAKKGQNSILVGLNYLKEFHIEIDSSCKNIISNFELYSWKKDRQGDYIEIPEDVNNDSIDALRYALSYDSTKSKVNIIKTNTKMV